MSRNYDHDDLDPEEKNWVAQKELAAQRRMLSRQQAPNLNPPQLSEKEYDEQRTAQMLRDQAAVRAAAVTPGSLHSSADPLDIDFSVTVPTAADVADVPAPAPAGITSAPAHTQSAADAVFWTCRIGDGSAVEIIYGSTWEELKTRLIKHPGLWTATEHRFPNTPANILGFFVPNQHVFPANTTIKQFEIIVKDGKVFKAEA